MSAVLACSDGGGDTGDRRSTQPVDGPAYEIAYDVVRADGAATARLVVQRPFRSRLTVFDDAGDVVADRAADLAFLAERDSDGDVKILTATPAPAPGDVRGDLLFEGSDTGSSGDTGSGSTRRVAGSECAVHRLGASIFSGSVVPPDAADASDVEVCIDGDGHVLSEVVRTDGEVVERWTATDLDVEPDIDDDTFDLDGTQVPAAEGGGSVREVEPTSRPPGEFFELDDAPVGFEHHGRYAVVPPQDADPNDIETRARVVAGVVDVWVTDDGGYLLIDQGGTLGRVPPFGRNPHGTDVDVEHIEGGIGEVFTTPTGAEVRVLIAPGRYLRVAGTLDGDGLVEIVRALRVVEGGGLVYIEE